MSTSDLPVHSYLTCHKVDFTVLRRIFCNQSTCSMCVIRLFARVVEKMYHAGVVQCQLRSKFKHYFRACCGCLTTGEKTESKNMLYSQITP